MILQTPAELINPPHREVRVRWTLAALFVCDLIKHGLLMFAGPQQPWSDSIFYWRLGQDAARGDWWLLESAQAFRTPLYPGVLAAMQASFGSRALLAVVVCQHACELLTDWLTALTVKNITGSARASFVAYAFCVALSARSLFANTVLTETFATFLVAILLWQFSRLERSPRWSTLCLAAFALGMQLLLRPAAVAFLPALAWVAWTAFPAATFRRRVIQATMAMGICGVVIAPWILRNQLVWNRSSLVVFTGRQLWTATFSPWPGGGLELPQTGASDRIRKLLADDPVNLRHNWSVGPALARQGLTDVEVDDLMRDASLEAIRAQSKQAAIHFGARCLTFWYVKDWEIDETAYPSQKMWQDQRGWSSRANSQMLRRLLHFTPERQFWLIWLWTILTWLGIAGMLLQQLLRRSGIALGLMLGCITILTAAFEIPLYRYRCIVEPAMVIASVVGAGAWWRMMKPPR